MRHFIKIVYLLYNLEIKTIFPNFNFEKISTLFGVNSFYLKSWWCKIWDIQKVCPCLGLGLRIKGQHLEIPLTKYDVPSIKCDALTANQI